MIKFFRKIRQQLMAEKKIGKYLLYALGEILLVVIGILIALSLNNWNQKRKDSKQELAILQEISIGLKGDSSEISQIKGTYIRVEYAIQQLQKKLDNKPINEDSLGYYFGWSLFMDNESFGNTAPFENLKAKGLDLIKSEPIKKLITSHYEKSYGFINQGLSEIFVNHDDFRRSNTLHFDNIAYFDNIRKNSASIRAIQPYNMDELRADRLYRTLLNTRLAEVQTIIYFTCETIEENIQEIREAVQLEIAKLERQ